MKAQRGRRGIALLLYSFLNLNARWGGWLTPHPGRYFTRKKTQYSLYRRLCGPQGRSGRVRKISSPPGFDPRTVLCVASRYNDYAIPAHNNNNNNNQHH